MPELRVLFIGLDNAGKTTLCARILSRLNVNIAPNDTLVPTIGVEAHIAKLSNYVYKVFDMGGSGHFRSLWQLYASEATHIVLVIDGSDKDRFFCIRDEIQQLIQKIRKSGQQIMITANKSDLTDFIDCQQLTDACKFNSILHEFQLLHCNCSALNDQISPVLDFLKITDIKTQQATGRGRGKKGK